MASFSLRTLTIFACYSIIAIKSQSIVWESLIDLCYWQEKSIYKPAKKCEGNSDIIVERRINAGIRPYWCIVVNNRKRIYRNLLIQFNGTAQYRTADYYVRNINETSSSDNYDSFVIKATIGRIVISPKSSDDEFQNIISIKLNDVEMCRDDNREYELSHEPKNINEDWFVEQCKDLLGREFTEPTVCERISEITIEELSMNDNVNFWCLIVIRNSQGPRTSTTGVDDLDIYLTNENFEIKSSRFDSIRTTGLYHRKFRITDTVTIMAIHPADYNFRGPDIESIKYNNYEACDRTQHSGTGFVKKPKKLFICGEQKLKHRGLISFGTPTYPGEYPWQAAIYLFSKTKQTKEYICGGSLISSKHVLTAAHCLTFSGGTVESIDVTVTLGKTDLSIPSIDSIDVNVSEVIVHENFEHFYLDYDIALLKFKTEIQFSEYILPICLNQDNFFNHGDIGTIAGWGVDEVGEDLTFMHQATMPIIQHRFCRESRPSFFRVYLTENNFCAGYKNGTSVCLGDSGSGLIYEIDSRWFVGGIVSLAHAHEGRCNIAEFVLFTNVTQFYDWINYKLYEN